MELLVNERAPGLLWRGGQDCEKGCKVCIAWLW